ncbi:uncharacterized protein LOC123292818 [Chrysoperla carnea]|uniref:uncharacterized protein LOC123292818 n=1 Tax=Chrysoperla carnea TaxID=189513 RepID=UPI001D05DE3E|nr:uncharacterized protein LOC123292818 [Chrysoperla carnea]
MSMNRIQKLLFSEYCDFDDMVLVESPFAEATRDGKGVRQVNIGLTPSKLIMAMDVIPSANESKPWCLHNIDPEIETFELISIYPIDCVNLSIFRRKKRQSIKAHFCNNRIKYYELGGFEKRKMFWNLWCERVKFLSPNDITSSRSETSVGSSSSTSTLYLINAKTKYPRNKMPQMWCTFGAGDGYNIERKWNEKDLYLGNRWEQVSSRLFQPLPGNSLTSMKKIDENEKKLTTINESSTVENISINDKIVIPENEKSIFRADASLINSNSNNGVKPDKNLTKHDKVINKAICRYQIMQIVEHAVFQWENSRKNDNHTEIRHRRRYAFSPQPHFLYGLGPWNVRIGERDSVQAKSVVSEVKIHRQPLDPELRLPVSKRQLSASISVDSLLNKPKMINTILVNSTCWNLYPSDPIKLFWTPEYWYRPKSPYDLQNYKKYIGVGTFPLPDKHRSETSLEYMRRKLQINTMLSIWDFDSTTLAYQLTIIDRDLFLKIKEIELGIVVWQKSCKNAPNISAIIAFSHRICCLVTTEIIKQDIEKLRSRVICRFISIADNCNRICNFQSCKSVLCGLQSPPVYRLHLTWSYIRRKYFSKYQLFEKLCKLYRDPRLPAYQRAFSHAKQNYPYLPYIGDILFQLMDKIPKPCKKQRRNLTEEKQHSIPLTGEEVNILKNAKKIESSSSLPNVFQRFLLAFIPSSKPNPYRTTLETIKLQQEAKQNSNLRSKVLHKKVCNTRSRIIHNNVCNKHRYEEKKKSPFR